MKRFLLAGVGVLTLAAVAGPAAAADLSRRYEPIVKAPPILAPIYNWTGFYIGVNGGGAWGHSKWDSVGGFDLTGGLVGGTVGYNWQWASPWVLGVEGDIDWSNIGGTSNAPGCPGCTVQNNWLGTARGRAGYAFGGFLPYVTGGLAFGDVKASVPGFAGQTNTQVGWSAGAGAEYALTRNWSAKVEYLHVDLGRFDCGVNCGGTPTDNVDFHGNLVRGGINFRF